MAPKGGHKTVRSSNPAGYKDQTIFLGDFNRHLENTLYKNLWFLSKQFSGCPLKGGLTAKQFSLAMEYPSAKN